MIIVNSYSIAVLMCIITMLCWGSWANTQKMASKKWPFQLFYWDYSIGILLFSIFIAFTMGSMGNEGRSFLADLKQADITSLGSAFTGGIVFNLANILIVIAIDITGMAVAFPVGIGLALIIGVFVNYFAAPTGNPAYLFLGVASVTLAIILDAFAYKKLANKDKGTPLKGILISILGGILMGFFYRFVAASMFADFARPETGKLTPYTAVVLFSIGLFISNFIFNSFNMYFPISGSKTTYKTYFTSGNIKLHSIGILGGAIWCLGMSFNIIASGSAGFAISYGLGQGATMIAALWGVFIWKEFKNAPKGTSMLINLMFLFFVIGLGLIIFSRIL